VLPFLHGEQTHSDLRARASSFHHVQLLPARSIPAFGPRQECVCPDSPPSPGPLRVLPRGLRRHAGSRSFADRRADQGNAFHCDSSVEAASLAQLAPQKESDRWTIEFELRKRRALTAANLAEKVLRLQRMESKKESRKAPLHAHEPVEEKIGRSPEGLALEQLFVLLESQTRIDPGRPRPLTRLKQRKSQTHRPFENREGAATRKIKTAWKGAPPAEV
jgi:hypothetical protein